MCAATISSETGDSPSVPKCSFLMSSNQNKLGILLMTNILLTNLDFILTEKRMPSENENWAAFKDIKQLMFDK